MNMKYRRLKASRLTIPKHKYEDPFRIVMLELRYLIGTEYSTSIEVISQDMPWFFCYNEFTVNIPQARFEERMKENGVEEDMEFEPDEEYSKWV
jgi:hypothetical protein